jgi:branched-chain amino acid transport system ATP-binding protein
MLKVERISKRFGGLAACTDVSFSVAQSEIVGLIGPNGAGKTTLFNVITGYHKPNAGCVAFCGRDITALSPHAVARLGIARTFQLSRPFGELSVLDNVIVGALAHHPRRSAAIAVARESLELVRFSHRAGVPAYDLTATERKRLDLARALALQPKLLFLDEVVAGSNEREMAEILDLVLALKRQGLGIVMVEHVLPAVMSVSDRVVVLDAGKVIAEGPPAAIRKDSRAIEVYFGTQAG